MSVKLVQTDGNKFEKNYLQLTVRKLTSRHPSRGSKERGKEKQTRSGFLAAISSTTLGRSRLPISEGASITVSQKGIIIS